MSEDILTQLRQFCDCTDRGKCFDCECADEIERLRANVKDLQMIIQLLKLADEAEND